jgi:hypothetical protein
MNTRVRGGVAGVVIGLFTTCVPIAACSSASSLTGALSTPTLDCAWLGDAQKNCWYKAMIDAYTDCALPDATTQGKLAADDGSCTYANGDVDTFTTPLAPYKSGTTDVSSQGIVATRGGKECFSFKVIYGPGDDQEWDLKTKSGLVKLVNANKKYTATCPDGSSVDTFDPYYYTFLACNTPPPGSHAGQNAVAAALPARQVLATDHAPFDLFPTPDTAKGPLSNCK